LLFRSDKIDELRGLSAILVVIYHFFLVMQINNDVVRNFGFLGVKLFFIISGFLLVASYKRNVESHGKLTGTKIYFSNRFWRIVPAYYINLIVVILLVPMFLDYNWVFSKGFLWQVIQHFFFLEYFIDKSLGFGINNSYWTLCIEMVWYLVVPFIFYWFNSVAKIIVLTVLSVLYLVLLEFGYLNFLVEFFKPNPVFNVPVKETILWLSYQLPGQFVFFGAGILLWRSIKWLDKINPPAWLSWVMVISSLAVIYGSHSIKVTSMLGLNLYYLLLSVLIFITIYLAKNAKLFLAWFGKISYSLYLWNYPLLVVFKKMEVLNYLPLKYFVILYTALLLVISSISYYFVEEVGILRKNKRANGNKVVVNKAVVTN